MTDANDFADLELCLSVLRGRARTMRGLTSDPQLRWDLVEAESLADVMIARNGQVGALALQANAAYLMNVLSAIEEKIGSHG
jgi:hypothetical protein